MDEVLEATGFRSGERLDLPCGGCNHILLSISERRRMWCFCGTMENAYLPTFARMDGWMEHYLGGEQTVKLIVSSIELE